MFVGKGRKQKRERERDFLKCFVVFKPLGNLAQSSQSQNPKQAGENFEMSSWQPASKQVFRFFAMGGNTKFLFHYFLIWRTRELGSELPCFSSNSVSSFVLWCKCGGFTYQGVTKRQLNPFRKTGMPGSIPHLPYFMALNSQANYVLWEWQGVLPLQLWPQCVIRRICP